MKRGFKHEDVMMALGGMAPAQLPKGADVATLEIAQRAQIYATMVQDELSAMKKMGMRVPAKAMELARGDLTEYCDTFMRVSKCANLLIELAAL